MASSPGWTSYPGGRIYTSPPVTILEFSVTPAATLQYIAISLPPDFFSYSLAVKSDGSILSYGSASIDFFKALRTALTSGLPA